VTYEANVAERNGKRLLLGSAEIRAFSETKEVYAAPNLIYHYVSVHKYRPPECFLEAVRTGPRPPSAEYTDRLSELGLALNTTPVPENDPTLFRFVKTQDGVIVVKQ